MDGMQVFGEPKLGLLIYGSEREDTYPIWKEMVARGWFSPPLTEPDSIHLMISPGHARVVDDYISELREVVAKIRSADGIKSKMKPQYS